MGETKWLKAMNVWYFEGLQVHSICPQDISKIKCFTLIADTYWLLVKCMDAGRELSKWQEVFFIGLFFPSSGIECLSVYLHLCVQSRLNSASLVERPFVHAPVGDGERSYYKILHEAGVKKFQPRCLLEFCPRLEKPRAKIPGKSTEVWKIFHRPSEVLFLLLVVV